MKIKLVCLLFMIMSSQAYSNVDVVLGGFSVHTDGSHYETKKESGIFKKYNEKNSTIGLCYNDYCAAYSKLSYDNDGYSIYNENFYDFTTGKYIKFGMRLGVIYGYGKTPINKNLLPIIQPIFAVKATDGLDIQMGFLLSKNPVLTFNIKYKI